MTDPTPLQNHAKEHGSYIVSNKNYSKKIHAKETDTIAPLCATRTSGTWIEKDYSVIPDAYVTDRFCKICLRKVQGNNRNGYENSNKSAQVLEEYGFEEEAEELRL